MSLTPVICACVLIALVFRVDGIEFCPSNKDDGSEATPMRPRSFLLGKDDSVSEKIKNTQYGIVWLTEDALYMKCVVVGKGDPSKATECKHSQMTGRNGMLSLTNRQSTTVKAGKYLVQNEGGKIVDCSCLVVNPARILGETTFTTPKHNITNETTEPETTEAIMNTTEATNATSETTSEVTSTTGTTATGSTTTGSTDTTTTPPAKPLFDLQGRQELVLFHLKSRENKEVNCSAKAYECAWYNPIKQCSSIDMKMICDASDVGGEGGGALSNEGFANDAPYGAPDIILIVMTGVAWGLAICAGSSLFGVGMMYCMSQSGMFGGGGGGGAAAAGTGGGAAGKSAAAPTASKAGGASKSKAGKSKSKAGKSKSKAGKSKSKAGKSKSKAGKSKSKAGKSKSKAKKSKSKAKKSKSKAGKSKSKAGKKGKKGKKKKK